MVQPVNFVDEQNIPLVKVCEQGGEINEDAIGLVITDLDFGMAIMRPTSLGDFAKYFALKASASGISLVGVEGATVTADNLLVEINQSSPSVYGNPLFPVVDFETSYPSEQQALFDALVELLDANSNQTLDTGELNGVLEGGYTGDSISTAEELVLLLHAGGAPPDILTVDEVLEQLDATFVAAHELDIRAADADQDGKFDPAGYEVNTGGTPVYLAMKDPLIRAEGFLQINLFDTIILTGSVAFGLPACPAPGKPALAAGLIAALGGIGALPCWISVALCATAGGSVGVAPPCPGATATAGETEAPLALAPALTPGTAPGRPG